LYFVVGVSCVGRMVACDRREMAGLGRASSQLGIAACIHVLAALTYQWDIYYIANG
jgi:hypothetical protein